MPIKQEDMIAVIAAGIALEKAIEKTISELKLASKAIPESAHILQQIYFTLKSGMMEADIGTLHYWQKYYKSNAQNNLMRRASMAGLKTELQVSRAHEAARQAAQGIDVDAEYTRYLKSQGEARQVSEAPPEDNGWEALRKAASEPPQPVHTPPMPPGAVRLTLGLGNAPPTVMDPFAGEEDPMTDGEREAMARQGVRGQK